MNDENEIRLKRLECGRFIVGDTGLVDPETGDMELIDMRRKTNLSFVPTETFDSILVRYIDYDIGCLFNGNPEWYLDYNLADALGFASKPETCYFATDLHEAIKKIVALEDFIEIKVGNGLKFHCGHSLSVGIEKDGCFIGHMDFDEDDYFWKLDRVGQEGNVEVNKCRLGRTFNEAMKKVSSVLSAN